MANVIYVAPTVRGTGDGSSAANAHRLSNNADVTWLLSVLANWHAELTADETDVGINDTTQFRTTAPGFEPDYGDKSYVFDIRSAVYVRRVCFLTDQGNYAPAASLVGTGTWINFVPICPPPADPLTAGTAGHPPIRLVHFVGYRSSDGVMSHQTTNTTTSRTQSIPTKSGSSSTWTNSANYTARGQLKSWTGASSNVDYTWTVTDPSPVRAVFVGNRTPDPRTQTQIDAKVQWGVYGWATGVYAYDPDGTGTEPKIRDSAGNPIVVRAGQTLNPATKTVTTVVADYNMGGYLFQVGHGLSNMVFQGFEFLNWQAPFNYGASGIVPTHFHGFRDIVCNNTRYGIWRGDLHYDVEFSRWQLIGVAQKHLNPGQYCQRWAMKDLRVLGNWVTGDQYPTLIGAADGDDSQNAWMSGCYRFERIIIENLWTGAPDGKPYVNGDGIDMEIQGVAIRDYYADLTPDGAVDNKTRPYWTNWNSIAIFNGFFRRNKRCFRSWAPAGFPERVAPHVMRNVTVAGAREYGIFMRSAKGHHKYITFYNADGRCNFMDYAGESYVAVSNDNQTIGDQDCVIHQAFDARPSTAAVSTYLNSNTALGGNAAPYRNRLWSPLTPPATLTVAVNGVVQDNGAPLAVTNGDVLTIHPSGMPTGTVYSYTANGPGSFTRSGDDATFTVSL